MSKYLMTFTWHHKSMEPSGNWYIGEKTTQTYLVNRHPAVVWDEWIKEAYENERSQDESLLRRGITIYDSLNFFAEVPDVPYGYIEEMS